jgi:hypothetical protein
MRKLKITLTAELTDSPSEPKQRPTMPRVTKRLLAALVQHGPVLYVGAMIATLAGYGMHTDNTIVLRACLDLLPILIR